MSTPAVGAESPPPRRASTTKQPVLDGPSLMMTAPAGQVTSFEARGAISASQYAIRGAREEFHTPE